MAGTVLDVDRDLDWDGMANARDLGGLPIAGGGSTLFGGVVRSDNPSRLTPSGWEALCAHGVRTVILLRTIGTKDPEPDPALIPRTVDVERVMLEDATDSEFRRRCISTSLWVTPLEWAVMLRYWPDRCAAAVAAVARAKPGGVVVSCGIGRDRTGLATFLLLALVGVPSDVIARDWSHSITRLVGDPHAEGSSPLAVLQREGMTVETAVDAALAMDVESRLLEGGLSTIDLAAIQLRLTS